MPGDIHGDSIGVTPDRLHAPAVHNPGTGAIGLSREPRIERDSIDDDGFSDARAIDDIVAGRRDESDGRQFVEDGIGGEAEFIEGLARQNAGAVHGLADSLMFFQHDHVIAALCEAERGVESTRTGSDNDCVVHSVRSFHLRTAGCQYWIVVPLPPRHPNAAAALGAPPRLRGPCAPRRSPPIPFNSWGAAFAL